MAKPPTPKQQAQSILAGQQKPISLAAAEAQRQAQAQKQASQAATLALVKALGAQVAPAGQTYDTAVQQQQALAQGAAGLLGAANPNAQIQADLNTVNAPAEQHAQLAQQLGQQFGGQGGVLNIMQGSIPGASLVAQKAAQQGFLAGLPSVVALGGQRAVSALQQQALANAAQVAQERAKVAAQLPGLALDIQNRREDVSYRNRQAQTAIDEAAANRQFQAEQAATSRAFQAEQARLGRQLTPYEKAQITLATRAAAQKQALGGLTPYEAAQLRLSERRLADSEKKSGTGAAGLTQTQVRAARAKGNQLLAHVREARALASQGALITQGPRKGEKWTKPTYDESVKVAEQMGIPLEVVVPMLNRIYPAQYEVTPQGTLKQIGIRGYPSTFAGNPTGRKRKRRR